MRLKNCAKAPMKSFSFFTSAYTPSEEAAILESCARVAAFTPSPMTVTSGSASLSLSS